MKRLSVFIFLVIITPFGCKKGAWDQYMEHEPNRSPVIISFTSDFSGAPEPGDVIRITCEASDPNRADTLRYTFSSDSGSFTEQSDTQTGSSVTFITGEITGGSDVNVNVTVTDPKNASVSQTLDLGRSRLGPVITYEPPLSTIGADGYTSVTIRSDSSGYYQVLVDDPPVLNHVRPLFTLKKNEDVSIHICGHLYSGDKFIPGIPRLASTTAEQNVHIIVVDRMNQYSYITVPVTSSGTTPNPGNGNPLLWATEKTDDGFTLNWVPGSDTETEQPGLEYSVYYSMGNNIKSVESTVTNGILIQDWTHDINNLYITGLQSSAAYYYMVLVKDADDVISHYNCLNFFTDDKIPPVPGGSGNILISNVTDNSLTLSWERAQDEKSLREDLKYKVVYSEKNSINTVAKIEAGLLLNEVFVIIDWSADIYTIDFDRSPDELTTLYYNVLVSDEAGNVSVYNIHKQFMGEKWIQQYAYRDDSDNIYTVAFRDVEYGNGLFVAVGVGGIIQTSDDGINWIRSILYTGVSQFLDITFGNNLFVAVGSRGEIFTSPDGFNWTKRDTGAYPGWFIGICYGKDLYIIVDASGEILTSPDGIHWTRESNIDVPEGAFRDIVYGNGLFVIASQTTVYTSHDGFNWINRNVHFDNTTLKGITYGNGQFVAVGENIIITSTDGINWERKTPDPSGSDFHDIQYANNLFVMVGASGIQTSFDTNTWKRRLFDSELTDSCFAITYGNGKFVVVGMNGLILTSP